MIELDALPDSPGTAAVPPDSTGAVAYLRRRHQFRKNMDDLLEGVVTGADGATLTVVVDPPGWREPLSLDFVVAAGGFLPAETGGWVWEVFFPGSEYDARYRAFLEARDRFFAAQRAFGEAAAVVRTAGWDEIGESSVLACSAADGYASAVADLLNAACYPQPGDNRLASG